MFGVRVVTDTQFDTTVITTVWSSAFVAGIGALTVTDWLAFGGFIIAFLTMIGNFLHKRQMRKLREREVENEERRLGLSHSAEL